MREGLQNSLTREPRLEKSQLLTTEDGDGSDFLHKSTNLEGIMSYQGKQSKQNGSQAAFQSLMRSNVFQKDDSGAKQENSQQKIKPFSGKTKELATEAMETFQHLMTTLAALQKETGKVIKTHDLEREFNKVAARVKAISRLE